MLIVRDGTSRHSRTTHRRWTQDGHRRGGAVAGGEAGGCGAAVRATIGGRVLTVLHGSNAVAVAVAAVVVGGTVAVAARFVEMYEVWPEPVKGIAV